MGIAGRSRLGTLLVAIVLAALPVRSAASQDREAAPPTLDAVLARAAEYVGTFHERLSSIVAEEIYVQTARTIRRARAPAESTTTLRSDLLLVRAPGADRYVEFRDVFEVDGRALRDREERLTRLFLNPAASVDQLRAIIDESARHNIGSIPRNVNTPMLTLHFLQAAVQKQFRFRSARRGQPQLGTTAAMPGRSVARFTVTTEMWVIEFRETGRPTIIRTGRSRDFPATGRFWIDPQSGAVRMSELVMENPEVTATINVSYQSEPLLGLLVPVEMRERYRSGADRVEGVATYGRFRQFQVKTDLNIGKPPGPSPRS